MSEFPTGTVTFLFTDIEGSTKLWQDQPHAMRQALARHDEILEQSMERHRGFVVHPRGEGDGRFAVFCRASDAVAASADLQRTLYAEPWATTPPLRVRLALNTGEADLREGDYYGSAVNRCARLRGIAHGGQILLSQSTLDLVRDDLPPPLSVRDLGVHRLKDLIRPEHIYQLTHPELPADFPPLKSLNAGIHNLPIQLTSLIGRSEEVRTLCASLCRPDIRLLTLTGSGGTGKTRLAMQVAADALDNFADGVFFVDLSALRSADLVASTMALAFGLKEAAGVSSRLTLQEHIGSNEILFVLDNFEQVIDAAPMVGELLVSCPRLKLLVTSQIALHVRAEREFPVSPLPLPGYNPAASWTALADNPSVQLFVERARAVRPDFTLTRENASAVAEICARLDGLPLAIELAAARVKIFPPQALLARLTNRLQLLTGGARDLPERQQTLRSTIAWSYDLLTESEKALFRRLSVFAGGCTIEAAKAVCNTAAEYHADVLHGIGFLIDKSLLRQEEEEEGQPRFLMLETIREYGIEALAATGEDEALCRRHASFFVALAQQAEPWLLTSGQVEWLNRLEAERDNLRAALTWSLDKGEIETSLRLANALWCFWLIYGHVAEGWQHLEILMAQPQVEDFPLEHAKIKVAAGAVAYFRGDHARARTLCSEGLPLCRAAGAKFHVGLALSLLGGLSFFAGDLDQATSQWEESLALAEESANHWLMSVVLSVMGVLALHRGDVQRSLELSREGLAYAREVGENWSINQALYNLGLACTASAAFGEASACFLESLSVSRALNFYLGISLNLVGLAGLSAAQGNFERAARLLGAGSAVREVVSAPIPLGYQMDYRRVHDGVSGKLGQPAFANFWAEGRAMTVEQAIAFGTMQG